MNRILALVVFIVFNLSFENSAHGQVPIEVRAIDARSINMDDYIIRLYHSQTDASPPMRSELLYSLEFLNNSSRKVPFSNEAAAANNEKNSFTKEERSQQVFDRYLAYLKDSPLTEQLVIVEDVYVKPYDFNTKSFEVCVNNSTCGSPRTTDVLRTIGRYGLFAKVKLSFAFATSETKARELEAVLARSNRRLKAVYVLELTGSTVTPTKEHGNFYSVFAKVIRVDLKSPPSDLQASHQSVANMNSLIRISM